MLPIYLPVMRKMNILLADDNKHFIQALKFMLLELTPSRIENIYEVSNGKDALDLLKKNHIDMVFMDVEMPIMNGIEATRKATEYNRFLIIIAISFHQELEYVMQMLEAGARNYIVKEDINKEQLLKLFETSMA